MPDLMHALGAAGIKLSVKLAYEGPKGALTPDLRDALQEHRDALVLALARRPEIEANLAYLDRAGRWHRTPDGRWAWTAHGEWVPPA